MTSTTASPSKSTTAAVVIALEVEAAALDDPADFVTGGDAVIAQEVDTTAAALGYLRKRLYLAL